MKHGSARDFIKICIGERKKADILNRKNFLLKFIVLGCYAPSIFIILLPILSYIYRESSSVNFVHLSRIYIYFFRLNGLCPFRLGLFFIVKFVLFFHSSRGAFAFVRHFVSSE